MTIDRICTIGPASNNKDTLSQLIRNGMNIIRLNLSHGSHESHKEIIQLVKSLDDSIKILGDLQGPKIRLGVIEENGVTLQAGDTFTLYIHSISGNKEEASVDYPGIINDVKVGNRILINDGQVELTVEKISEDKIETKVKVGGDIASHKGVNLPGTIVSLPAITEKDKKDIQFLLSENVDFIACSFVRKPSHIQEIRNFIRLKNETSPNLIAKVETMEAIENFQEICKEVEGIMIARGDLGVELPYQFIPLLQKMMIHECNRTNTYVITATQMLQSMVDYSIPTRAEVTDVFQAVLDGTNAVMLSAESASGDHPIESIKTLRLVSEFAEHVKKDAPFVMKDVLELLHKSI
ncbi:MULTISPECIES: pyruvate kinase [Bacillus]|uniref:Pyruvate kinase n=1 Tax=Bacillus pseudomycoides TaxID=64104 RepID=A0AAJ1YWE8_9BACI|nr:MULTISPECIES: pyruvate kinase [Bacillus]EEM04744.1 Pyruvate kinase [Bacillus pseudomycoides]EEM10318.1 Pyruvate kinase [Bacillus pseudomycoides]KFN12668.1 pyruvate kinase [Bacillus pseudomycoides]MBD5798487.1 pyruvate kinase [Bacillus pseudomycoides]MBJ8030300.1 pyruvate kinase [Bacillus cereus group sp. N21]